MTTREECIASAGEAYGAILADPIRREEIRRARAAYAATQAAGPTSTGEKSARPSTTRKSA